MELVRKMSKYSDEIDATFKDLNAVKKATKEVIKSGGKLALQKYHDAKSLKKLKEIIKECK